MKKSKSSQPNYRAEYDDYWSRKDRIGEASGDLEQTADQIVLSCGLGTVLDVGSGEGALVAALLRRGVDAQGVDVSKVVVARCNKRIPGRFTHGSILSLPFEDDSFHTVVSTDCMEHLAPEDVPKALREIHRVTGLYVFLKIATSQDRDDHWHLTVEGRVWWETRCFEAGFRKHPKYYKINDYEALNSDGWQICVLLEKIPKKALKKYSLSSLSEERGLHMDMLRDTGERSDAHVIRYQWACNYIKPGDRVLDAACGLGYGGHVIRHLAQSAEIIGIDGSEYAVDYATQSFTNGAATIEYRLGMLPGVLASFEDASFDTIVSFETLEHVEDPQALLREFNRLLTPGGRVIVSVPNDWSDETGQDPNPYHLHVYDWVRLQRELSEYFLLEEAFAQTASQCKISSQGKRWERRPRSLRKVALADVVPEDCEWWLMVAMKSPLGTKLVYQERVFHNIAQSGHPSICYSACYQSPWLMHAMVNVGSRLKNDAALENLALGVIATTPKDSNDYAAALCVEAYRVATRRVQDGPAIRNTISKIDAVTANPPADSMGLRWTISLLFIKAKLLQTLGNLEKAKAAFVECASLDVRSFGIHLATKTTEAWFVAGKIAYSLGNRDEAYSFWERGVDFGSVLLSASLDDILINRSFPNRFNHGDGVREYAVAWDNIARCANGLHLLKRGGQLDYAALDNCFQTEYTSVTRDLLECRPQLSERTQELVKTRQVVVDRTALLEAVTQELVDTRETLSGRTELLEKTNAVLSAQTQELVKTRKTLSGRTELLEKTNTVLSTQTQELVKLRQALAGRTELLEKTNKELQAQTQELVKTRDVVVDRTALLEKTNKDLLARTKELVETRQTLAGRTELLEKTNKELQSQTQELVKTRDVVVDRTALLEKTNKDLLARTKELVETRQTLAGRTELLEKTNKELQAQTQELVKTRDVVVDRTALLEKTNKELQSQTQELVKTRDVVVDRTALLEKTNKDLLARTKELVETRQTLAGRTELLEKTNKELQSQTQELVKTRDVVVERTTLLEKVSLELGKTHEDLLTRTQELVETREALSTRTELLEKTSADLAERTQELLQMRQVVIDKAAHLESITLELEQLHKRSLFKRIFPGKKK